MKNEVLNFFNKTRLTIDVLDQVLSENYLKDVDKNPNVQCFFNLSQVRFAQLQAITKLTLIIARCLEKTKFPILVAFPTVNFTRKELNVLTRKPEISAIRENVQKRKNANLFLKTFRFDKVLLDIARTFPDKSVLFTESFEFATTQDGKELEKAIDESFTKRPLTYQSYKNSSNYRCICPLTWITCKNDATVEAHCNQSMFEDVEKILGHSEKGLDPLDAEAIKNVVLPELIKNVREHSRTSHAVLAIGLIATKSILRSEKSFISSKLALSKRVNSNIETPYLNWLSEHQNNSAQTKSQVEIYFGDIGVGILTNNLKEKYLRDCEYLRENRERVPSLEDQMKWVYSRWAAEKTKLDEEGHQLCEIRSGTKGLYRIRRIIRRYEGIFHITTASRTGYVYDSIYRDFGTSRQENVWEFTQQRQYGFEGTFVQIKMCPFSKATKFRFVMDNETVNTKWEFCDYLIELDKSGEPVFRETDFSNKIKELHNNLYGINRDQNIEDACIVIFIDLCRLKENCTGDPYRKIKKFIHQKFEYFSLYGHPASIILVLSGHLVSNSILEAELSSLTDKLSQRMKNVEARSDKLMHNEHYYAPVMVIGENRKVFWFGGHKESISFLNSKTNELDKIPEEYEKNKKLFFSSEIVCDDIEKIRIMKALHADGATDLLYHFHNVSKIFQNGLKEHYTHNKGLFCSPSLEIINHWFEVEDFFSNNRKVNSLKYAWLLSLRIEQFFNDSKNSNKEENFDYRSAYLLIDHSQHQLLAEEFARLTGIPQTNIRNLQRDIDPSVPHRVKLFPKKSNVILLTTIISSSETARRLVKVVRRDSAVPKCLLCLYNRRIKEHPDQLSTWNDDTTILAIWEKEKSAQDKNLLETVSIPDGMMSKIVQEKKKLDEYFNDDGTDKQYGKLTVKSPQYESENAPIEQPKDWVILRDWINKSSALHYSHVGIFNSRHFTFYLDKQKLLKFEPNNPSWKNLKKEIEDWRCFHDINSDDFSLYLPDNLFSFDWKESSFYRYLCTLCSESQIHILDKNKETIAQNWNKKNIVYIDFGILSGTSITSFATEAMNRGAANMLACILFEQSNSSLIRFFPHINRLAYCANDKVSLSNSKLEDKSDVDGYTGYLPFEEFEEFKPSTPLVLTMKITIRYLFNFPLTYFTSELCPLCEHQKALEKYMIDIPYLIQFSEERQQRLRLLSVQEIAQRSPSDFYYTKNEEGFAMSSEFIWKMFELKCMLEYAAKNTHARIRLFKHIYRIHEELDIQLKNPNSELFALLFFLAHEVYWFQRDPLTFRKFRILLGRIAKAVAGCPITTLKKYFCENKEHEINISGRPLNQATRYKYAAVSVLRSSNKKLFCENVRTMLVSASRPAMEEEEDIGTQTTVFSNNIVQNIYYHIISLCRNKYNTSLLYFEILKKQLPDEEIKSIGSNNFSSDQQTAGAMIRLQIEKALWRILYPSTSIFDDIRHLKTSFENYKQRPHPQPCEYSRNFMARPSLKTWYPLLKILHEIRLFARRNKLIYIPEDLTLLELAEWNEAEKAIEQINKIIKDAEKNANINLSDDKSFLDYGKKINSFFINFAGQYGEEEDSVVKRWIDDMVTNFYDALEIVFPRKQFINRHDIDNGNNMEFFFPLSYLINCLYHVKSNMIKRKISNKSLEEINIFTQISNEETDNIRIIFKYDSIYEEEKNHDGGLTQFKKRFKFFDASLEWHQPSEIDPYFKITMIFKAYEPKTK